MQQIKIYILLFAFCTALTSCLKDDVPVKLPDPGNVLTNQVPLGQYYLKQFFFDLGTNQIVGENEKTAWDLGFENGTDGWRIVLNSSKLMFAYNTLSTDFNAVTSDAGAKWTWDVASGNLDSTAVGTWGTYADGKVTSNNHVYLLDLGRDATGVTFGKKKIVFEKMENGIFHLRFANIDGSGEHVFEVSKNDNFSFSYFSFDDGGKQVQIAPEKNSWDLQFTQYMHIFSETPSNIPQPDTMIAYLVTGVLQNPNSVEVAEDFTKEFSEIEFNDTYNYIFGKDADVIGYNWKFFNFNEAYFSIVPGKNYIIKDTEGYFYKLRFIDFYSNSGEKGFPKFEFQRL